MFCQIYHEFKPLLEEAGWLQNHADNLMELPFPFHANHPAYNSYVRGEINALTEAGKLDMANLKNLQGTLKQTANNVLASGQFPTLNSYFKSIIP